MSPIEELKQHFLNGSTDSLVNYTKEVDLFVDAMCTAYNQTYESVGYAPGVILHMLLYDPIEEIYSRVAKIHRIVDVRDKDEIVKVLCRMMTFGYEGKYPVAYTISAEAYCSEYDTTDDEEQVEIAKQLTPTEDPLRKEVILHSSQSLFGNTTVKVFEITRKVPGDETTEIIKIALKTSTALFKQAQGRFSSIYEVAQEYYDINKDGMSIPRVFNNNNESK